MNRLLKQINTAQEEAIKIAQEHGFNGITLVLVLCASMIAYSIVYAAGVIAHPGKDKRS